MKFKVSELVEGGNSIRQQVQQSRWCQSAGNTYRYEAHVPDRMITDAVGDTTYAVNA